MTCNSNPYKILLFISNSMEVEVIEILLIKSYRLWIVLSLIEYNFFAVKDKKYDFCPITHTSHNTFRVGIIDWCWIRLKYFSNSSTLMINAVEFEFRISLFHLWTSKLDLLNYFLLWKLFFFKVIFKLKSNINTYDHYHFIIDSSYLPCFAQLYHNQPKPFEVILNVKNCYLKTNTIYFIDIA